VPISYRIDKSLNAIFTTGSGTVTDADLISHAQRITRAPDVPSGAIALVDFTNVQEDSVSADGVRQVAEIYRARTYTPRTAFVAEADTIYGMSRMFEMLRSDSEEEIRVFRDIGEAKSWLGLA